MKFVFALALLCLYVALMGARPNMDIQKRDAGSGGENRAEEVKKVLAAEKAAEAAEETGEKQHTDGETRADEIAKLKKEHAAEEETEEVKEKAEEKHELQQEQEQSSSEEDSSEESGGRKKRAAIYEDAAEWPNNFKDICIEFYPPSYGDAFCKENTPENTISYCADKRPLREIVQDAADEWNKKAGLNIQLDCATNIVTVQGGEGCWAWIGYQKDNKNVINLQQNFCFTTGVVLHEFGHVLGFMHEAKREDRDDHIKCNFGNILPKMVDQFTKSKAKEKTRYDVCSIMQYSEKAFSSNGKKTITLPGGDDDNVGPCMGNQQGLSLRDGKMMANYTGNLDHRASTKCRNGGYMLKAPNNENCICNNILTGKYCEDVITDETCGKPLKLHELDEIVAISTPNYEEGGDYDSNQMCVWAITGELTQNAKYVCVTFPFGWHLDEAYGDTCPWDWFEIISSHDLSLRTKRHCGVEKDPRHIVLKLDDPKQGNFFSAIVFRSDDQMEFKGFKAYVKVLGNSKTTDEEAKTMCSSMKSPSETNSVKTDSDKTDSDKTDNDVKFQTFQGFNSGSTIIDQHTPHEHDYYYYFYDYTNYYDDYDWQ